MAPTVVDSQVFIHLTTYTASFDIGFTDSTTSRSFVTDRTNKEVDWFDLTVDAQHDSFVKYLGAGKFTGTGADSSSGGPNGVTVDDQHRVWAGVGPDSTGVSSVKMIDPATDVMQTVYVGGTKRADELSYEPVH